MTLLWSVKARETSSQKLPMFSSTNVEEQRIELKRQVILQVAASDNLCKVNNQKAKITSVSIANASILFSKSSFYASFPKALSSIII